MFRKAFFLSLLLLTAICAARTCPSYVDEADSQLAIFSLGTGNPGCSPAMDYADSAEVAGIFDSAAKCFKAKGQLEEARAYFAKAGDCFVSSSKNATVSYEIMIRMYVSAGDDYVAAENLPEAQWSYQQAIDLYNQQQQSVQGVDLATIQQKLYELDTPMPKSIQQLDATPMQLDNVPIAVAVIALIALIGALLFYRK